MKSMLSVTVYKKVKTIFGSVNKTVTLEAVSDKGAVIRSESHQVKSSSAAAVGAKVSEFTKQLREDGYQVKVDGERTIK